jgi:hypothetical protein
VRLFTTAVIFAGLVSTAALSQQSNVNVNRSIGGPNSGPVEKKPERVATAAERKRGLRMLADTEGAVRSMEPATQALALVQMAKGFASSDKKKSIALLTDALAQVRDAQFDVPQQAMKDRMRSRIQEKVLSALLPLDPDAVEKMLDQVDANTKKVVLSQLLTFYQDGKQDEKAIEILEQITRVDEMPYDHASTLMSRLSEDQNLELRRIFTDALNSYDLHDDGHSMHMGGSFSDLITKFHSRLPAELNRQAIDTVLAHAKKADEPREGGTKPSISVASKKGMAQFDSKYEFELFNLLPTLQEIDPSYAEQLLKEHSQAKLFLAKYPGGLSSLTQGDGGEGDPSLSMMYNDGAPPEPGQGGGGGGRGPGGPPDMPSTMDMQKLAKIDADAAAHPGDAIAMVPTLASPAAQAHGYVGVARATMKKDAGTARTALRKTMDMLDKLPPDQQVQVAIDVAGLYQRMADDENARNAVEKAIDLASNVYKQDTDADDPNKAPKWYWPSTTTWRSAMIVATKMDPTWAQGLLKGIPDDDIRALNQLAIASEILKVPMNMVEIMTIQKRGVRMMMMNSDEN